MDSLANFENSARAILHKIRGFPVMAVETSSIPRGLLYGALAILLAVIALGIYNSYSNSETASPSPEMASLADGDTTKPAAVIAKLEERTRKNPKDVEAWQLLGWSYFELGRYGDAAAAYRTAAGLAPDRAIYWSSLGEALTMADAQDPMPAEAAAAFEKAYKLDSKDPRARYFLAVRRDLAGDHQGAVNDWLALLNDTPKDAPWEVDLVRTIEQVGRINKIDVTGKIAAVSKGRKADVLLPAAASGAGAISIAAAPIPGPTRTDMAAAAKLPPGQQQAMVISMVENLEGKLKKNPNNVNGWIMLMRSRITLGQTVKAASALKQAIESNPAAKNKLIQEAQVLGVSGA
jgi:cytochrome c-type biogenesis protein CcmH